MKSVILTINMVVDDEEVECFMGDTEEDILGQGDILKDWLREAPYNETISFKITAENNSLKIVKEGLLHMRRFRDRMFK